MIKFVKWDGKAEKAKLRLKEEQRGADCQRKQFACLVERFHRLACCPDQDNSGAASDCPKWQPPKIVAKDVGSNNKFKIEEDEGSQLRQSLLQIR